ncbi:peptidoglycan DD-metalloendopeptidase family protein [Aliiglaciecola sp. 3_MG-2023]|uniref:peptidoglycan DD-metalloendopeptidase family protein n=1 Tax=Aliiglaciecola sp. 3_MG-2023 TaxID=3062644 RepID=UPI0026E4392B|nr:peptidoglycan DD-metalloendopeptidase family protein [Aliiglaciecola sp. 3_MG-2023]MDO6692268.1 peptidoglycan DD-metalloendopeptidase family protein [Aliiglaciecola sp. 3_MG-2023]
MLLVLTSIFVAACSSRSTPAPVIELYQGRDYRDFPKDQFKGDKYIVQKGDTLFSIAWFSGNDYRDIASINKIKKPYSIYPGQELVLKSAPKQVKNRINNPPGQTRKTKTNRTVDPPQKQAYGESNKDVNKPYKRSETIEFPSRIEKWIWPAKGQLATKFSLSEQGSRGIEISGSRGDKVVAAAGGKVVYTGNALRGYGQLIIIKHSESFLSAYAHNDTVFVKEQQWVAAGQKIASMGSTGTDKIKLRFEVRYRGKSVDPLKYLPSK